MPIEVRYELNSDDVEALLAAYRNTWYGTDRDRADVERMLAGTDAAVALYDEGALVAFGHALTDDAFVAVLRDLVVTEPERGSGVGRRLVDELCAHPALAAVDRISVVCPDRLAGFYRSCGFAEREDAAVLDRKRGIADERDP